MNIGDTSVPPFSILVAYFPEVQKFHKTVFDYRVILWIHFTPGTHIREILLGLFLFDLGQTSRRVA